MRRVVSRVARPAALTAQGRRGYRVMPHLDNEIEELAEVQQMGQRWYVPSGNYCEPMRNAELMCDRLNAREARRSGAWPAREPARALAQTLAEDGKPHEVHYEMKKINFTVLGFDGHPFHFRCNPYPGVTLNELINDSEMNYGFPTMWRHCHSFDGSDTNHKPGCLVNIDLDTAANMLPPTRWEFQQLQWYRDVGRPDVNYLSRFSCCIQVTEELDGAVIALSNHLSKAKKEKSDDWGEYDNYATISLHKSRKVEPWAPMVEEPTCRDFPITFGLIWAKSWQDVYAEKYPGYKRKDGYYSAVPSNYASLV